MLDPISDMLTRIRNASSAGHKKTQVPCSKLKLKIVEIIKRKEFIDGYRVVAEEPSEKKNIEVSLKYLPGEKGFKSNPFIRGIKRISRQGQRIYVGKGDIPFSKNGMGFFVISTSKGLMTDQEARRNGVGGEVICEIW